MQLSFAVRGIQLRCEVSLVTNDLFCTTSRKHLNSVSAQNASTEISDVIEV